MVKRILFILLLLAPSCFGAIAHDTDTQASAGTSASVLSWSHTCTGSNLALVVSFFASSGVGVVTPTSVTYGAQTLTLANTNSDGSYHASFQYFLLGPSAGTNTITVTLPGVPAVNLYGAASSFTGVDQSNLDNTGVTGQQTSLASSFSISVVTSYANSWIVDANVSYPYSGDAGIFPLSPQVVAFTVQGTVNLTGVTAGTSYQGPVAAGTTSDGWSDSSTNFYGISAIALKAAGGGVVRRRGSVIQ